MCLVKRGLTATLLCWAVAALGGAGEHPAYADVTAFSREFNAVADSAAEIVHRAGPIVVLAPVIGTYSPDFDGSIARFNHILEEISSVEGFDPLLCAGTAYEDLSRSKGCDFALLVEGLRRAQSKHGVQEAIARAITWSGDVMYFPSENSCFSMARPKVDPLEIEVNGLYRLAWYSRECGENSVFLRGEGLLDLVGSGCATYEPLTSSSQATLQVLTNCARIHVPKRVPAE